MGKAMGGKGPARFARGPGTSILVGDLCQISSELLEVETLCTAAGEGGVEDSSERRHDRRRIDASRDEVHVDEVVADQRVISVDQVRNRLDETVPLVLGDLGHESMRSGIDGAAVKQSTHVRPKMCPTHGASRLHESQPCALLPTIILPKCTRASLAHYFLPPYFLPSYFLPPYFLPPYFLSAREPAGIKRGIVCHPGAGSSAVDAPEIEDH